MSSVRCDLISAKDAPYADIFRFKGSDTATCVNTGRDRTSINLLHFIVVPQYFTYYLIMQTFVSIKLEPVILEVPVFGL